ncbi:hypothetical protein [Paenibacillus radicis (ex Xue et al. 2023)]|uniref:Uncharacterized protein n=1 Tax=Paenibacillus radicis (ex Xue et al. 2023) TaxID=2972489 RepID=A0ABT1YGE4_9BACL|nr:hypothetical protein [Paenibacillus radicis (ex Xue et al. 2023)]MCR8631790.1 hypothetical protein [Paenibacillus radicis (ex Xue et al. 2023)]
MRTENQIKRKLNELIMSKKSLESRIAALLESEEQHHSEAAKSLRVQAEQVEESITLLEWVLDEPIGKYHA